MEPNFKHKSDSFPEIRKSTLDFLSNNLDDKLIYHSYSHTVKVEEAVIFYANIENVSSNDLIDLRLAALFHDAGYIRAYANNEPLGADIMKEQLSQFQIDAASIDKIAQIIISTSHGIEPRNILEQIICDADHDYLGTDEYEAFAEKLYLEKLSFEGELSEEQWLKDQIDYLKNQHAFLTESAISRRYAKKQEWIRYLEAQNKG